MTFSVATDKQVYAPGETVTATVSGAAVTFPVTITAQAGTATATTQYLVQGSAPVTLTDSTGNTWTEQPDGAFTSVAPAAPLVLSGFSGTEPSLASLDVAGVSALSWSGYAWESENWGTSPGQPKASQLAVDSSGDLTLAVSESNGVFWGAEADSARGDSGISGNTATWGYGTYQWVIGTDLSALADGLTLGLFTYWSSSKGGPAGQKEIDIEFMSSGGTRFVQLGYYADSATGITEAVPPYHVLVPGSQEIVKSSPQTIAQFTWLPSAIMWNIWYGTSATVNPDITLVVTEGQSYSYTQLYGGNAFGGTASIPRTGNQQVIMNLWGDASTAQTVTLKSFTYTPA